MIVWSSCSISLNFLDDKELQSPFDKLFHMNQKKFVFVILEHQVEFCKQNHMRVAEFNRLGIFAAKQEVKLD